MRRPSLLLTIGIAAVLVGGAWLISPAFSRAQAKPGKGQPTGTYLVKFVVGPLSLLGVGSVHTDGTWTMSDQSDFGGVPRARKLANPLARHLGDHWAESDNDHGSEFQLRVRRSPDPGEPHHRCGGLVPWIQNGERGN